MEEKLPIIAQLQMDASDPDVSVTNLLRKAKIVATKLDLSDLLIWVDRELTGYNDVLVRDLPPYRQVHGEPKALNPYHGWQPIFFATAKQREACSYAPIGGPIGPLEEIVLQAKGKDSGGLQFNYSPELKQKIIESLEFPADVKLSISMTAVHGVLDAVRNCILDWALKLEKAGITGDGLSFSEKDKAEARPVTQQITQQIFAQNIGHLGDVLDQASVINNQTASVSFDSQKVELIITEIEKTIQFLPKENQAVVLEHTKVVKEELQKHKKDQDETKIKSALNSVKNICEGITGNVVAQGIIGLISNLPF